MSFFEDLVDRAGRLLGIVTTTGEATIATEATAQTLATEATLAGVATEATVSGLATEATAALLATEATAQTLATDATVATLGTEATLAARASEATALTLATEATLGEVRDSLAGTLATTAHIIGPVDAFGNVRMVSPLPRIQIDAIYGILATDHETLTATGGSATAADSLFTCTTGLSVGGYGVIRSRRIIRYRPGQSISSQFTAAFTTGVALSLQLAGLFTSTDGLFFGYNGAAFGLTRRIAGAAGIYRLTVTVGSGGAENVTVTLNGTPFVVTSGGALSTSGLAERIAESGVFTGWTFATSPTSNGATVTFIQANPGATAGAFTLTSSGTAAGTFATVQAGAANDDATGFVPQTSWNVDALLGGAGGTPNPSGVLLDKTKLNVYRVSLPYLGAGAITWQVMLPTGAFQTVHVTQYPNGATIPSQKNPTYRVGWTAASLGSMTALTVTGASPAAFLDGESVSARDPISARIQTFNSGTTEYVAIAFRVRGEFGSKVNQREVVPNTVFVGVDETSTRIVNVRVILNPTLTGTVNWGYVNQSISCVETATPTTLTPSGGSDLATVIAASGASATINLAALDLRLEPGDVIALAVQTVSSTAVITASMNWQER